MKHLILAGNSAFDQFREEMGGNTTKYSIQDVPIERSYAIPPDEIWFVNDSKSISTHAKGWRLVDVLAAIVNIGIK